MGQDLDIRKFISLGVFFAFLVTTFGAVPMAQAQDILLPVPGVMVHLSPEFNPPILKGIKVHPDNPFRFDFVLDKGDCQLSNNALKDESSKLIKYFLASLTIPERDLWVNLSPYEKDRIVPESFGQTEMGRDLLAEDYMLKQITASLIYPEGEVGKKFWKRIYTEAVKIFGTTNMPVNTFNKVWIVPEKAVVFENAKAGTAYVVESKLKVMLEQDYLSLQKHEGIQSIATIIPAKGRIDRHSQLLAGIQDISALGSQIVREVVIPQLTIEVNENKNFSPLRQVYNSLILATWYKKKIKDSILSQVYEDKNKVAGINIDDSQENQRIYDRYLQAFRKGTYNYIREEIDPATQESIPRKYFSGGTSFSLIDNVYHESSKANILQQGTLDYAMIVGVNLRPVTTDNLILRWHSAWEDALEKSKHLWKHDSRFPFLYSYDAPIAYDPRLLFRRHVPPFLQLSQSSPKEKFQDEVSREDIANGIVGKGFKEQDELSLLSDPSNGKLIVIPNKFPKAMYASLLVPQIREYHTEREEYLASEFAWAQHGAVVEFHQDRTITKNHYHAHLYDPKDLPIMIYSNDFKPHRHKQDLYLGNLERYPIPHFAITSLNMESLMRATMLMHQILLGHNCSFSHDIVFNTKGELLVIFFIYNDETELFGSSPTGIIKSKDTSLTSNQIKNNLLKYYVHGEELNIFINEFWDHWNAGRVAQDLKEYSQLYKLGDRAMNAQQKDIDRELTAEEIRFLTPKFQSVLDFWAIQDKWREQNPDAIMAYIIRHQESISNVNQVTQSQYFFSPPTRRGQKQAKAMAEFLANVAFDQFVASDSERAYKTLLALWKRQGHRGPMPYNPSIAEVNMSPWGGIPQALVPKVFDPHGLFNLFPEEFENLHGNSMPKYMNKIRDFYGHLMAGDNPSKTIAIGTHGMAILAQLMVLGGIDAKKYHTTKEFLYGNGAYPNVGISIAAYHPKAKRWEVLVFKDNSYLPEDLKGGSKGREAELAKRAAVLLAVKRRQEYQANGKKPHPIHRDYYPRGIGAPHSWSVFPPDEEAAREHVEKFLRKYPGRDATLKRLAEKKTAMEAQDRAQASIKGLEKGGIDLTPANSVLQTQNNGREIKFYLDPTQLAQLQNAPGFVPVIINIQPMTNLRQFLGLNAQEVTTAAG